MSRMKWFESKQQGVVIVSLGHGDLLRENLCQVAREADIHTGVLMTGIGSLTFGRIHIVTSNDMPAPIETWDIEGPLEVVGFRGLIINYQPHIHISMLDKVGKYYGGHLEDGCRILTVSEISILRLPDIRLVRTFRDGNEVELLDWEKQA